MEIDVIPLPERPGAVGQGAGFVDEQRRDTETPGQNPVQHVAGKRDQLIRRYGLLVLETDQVHCRFVAVHEVWHARSGESVDNVGTQAGDAAVVSENECRHALTCAGNAPDGRVRTGQDVKGLRARLDLHIHNRGDAARFRDIVGGYRRPPAT